MIKKTYLKIISNPILNVLFFNIIFKGIQIYEKNEQLFQSLKRNINKIYIYNILRIILT